MVQSNHSALQQGLKLYTDGMRRFIKHRLVGAFPNNWWEHGVLRAVSDQQRTNLRREAEKDPNRDRADLLDPGHFVPVVTHHFRDIFAEAFHDYRRTQTWLQRADLARNDAAHPISGDMQADDVSTALYDMVQLLTAAELPEAVSVTSLRSSITGVPTSAISAEPEAMVEQTEAQDATADGAPSPSKTGIPYWWEVCEPHERFKNPSRIDEGMLAASLGRVFAGAADSEYLDPVSFLSQTYFTESLTQMLQEVASRLNGGDGASVTEVQTPFGGGKTHALLTFYHMVNSPREAMSVEGARAALGDETIPANARVLVFDGQEYGVDPWHKENGASVSTMWGELASQVDAGLYSRLLGSSDNSGTAPGNRAFGELLEKASPCLILIDEVVSYLVKLKFSNTRRSQNLYRQTVQFLQETLQLAGNVRGICVLLSLPKSRQEFGGLDPQQLQRELQIMEELQPRADRVVSKRTPINDEEIYLLMSRRLFKPTDSDAAHKVAQAYREIYERTPGQYDNTVLSTDYLKQQVNSYPFHPELIDVLYKKWSTSSDFPRTRAVLQLLANIVADQWLNRGEAYAIQSGHINLERERIRTRVVSAAGSGGGYDAVVASDIIGGDAHADYQDQKRGGEYAVHHISRGVATTLLAHSFGGRMRLGASPQELRLGNVAPNVGPEYVREVLDSLEQSLWYVHREGELLRFQTQPNIYRVIAETASNQSLETVADRLKEELNKAAGQVLGFRVLTWPDADGAIADSPEPTIALLNHRYAVTTDERGQPTDWDAIERLWDRVGSGLRTYRNSLVLVAPDAQTWTAADDAMRQVVAYEAVLGGRTGAQLADVETKDLTGRLRDKRDSLATSIVTAYRWVFRPGRDGLEVTGLQGPATKGQQVAKRVVDRLSDQDYGSPKILAKMSSAYFLSKVAMDLWKDQSEPMDIGEASRRFPQWTFLPILPQREETLRRCIHEGLTRNQWAIAIGDNRSRTYQELIETPDALDQLVTLFDGSASLVAGDFRDLVREQLKPPSLEEVTPDARQGDPIPVHEEEQRPEEPIEGHQIPIPPRRLGRVRLSVRDLALAKTNNLQPYLFKVLQDHDAGATVNITIQVSSEAGIPQEALEQRIVEGFAQLGIEFNWEEV